MRAWPLWPFPNAEAQRLGIFRQLRGYTCEMGSPRHLDAGRAQEVIAECDIDRALAHTYYSSLHHCASMARSAKILSAEYLAEMEKALEGKAN